MIPVGCEPTAFDYQAGKGEGRDFGNQEAMSSNLIRVVFLSLTLTVHLFIFASSWAGRLFGSEAST